MADASVLIQSPETACFSSQASDVDCGSSVSALGVGVGGWGVGARGSWWLGVYRGGRGGIALVRPNLKQDEG